MSMRRGPWCPDMLRLREDLGQDELSGSALKCDAEAEVGVPRAQDVLAVLGAMHEVGIGFLHGLCQAIDGDIAIHGDILASGGIRYVIATEDIEDGAGAGNLVREVIAVDHVLTAPLGDGVERRVELKRLGTR